MRADTLRDASVTAARCSCDAAFVRSATSDESHLKIVEQYRVRVRTVIESNVRTSARAERNREIHHRARATGDGECDESIGR